MRYEERTDQAGNTVFRIYVNRGWGASMGNMLEVLSGNAKAEDSWIDVVSNGDKFTVVDDSMTAKNGDWVHDSTNLGFAQWDGQVENLDNDSDEAQCFDMSNRLKWNETILEPTEFQSPSIERLCEALEHVAICAWCPGDI